MPKRYTGHEKPTAEQERKWQRELERIGQARLPFDAQEHQECKERDGEPLRLQD